MNFDLSGEQKMLAEQARRLLEEQAAPDRLRALITANAEWDEPLWRTFAEMGFLGVVVPEPFGGLGMTELDRGVLSEALGRANAAIPFFSSVVLAADAIQLAGTEEQKARWLPAIASGACIATFAYAEGAGGWNGAALQASFANNRLSGTKTPVADSGIAHIAVVLAKEAGAPVLVVVDLASSGVSRTRLESFDQLRSHYALSFQNVAAEKLAGASASEAIEQIFDRAAVQAAFEAVGGAEACLYMSRDYAMERQIFGRPLAGYQAIKHRLADIFAAVELARSSAYFAAWAVDNETPAAARGAAAAARLMATAAFEQAARENLQIHGGIGYTFEANCHFYYRRERTLALSLGNRERWANRLIDNLPASVFEERAA